MILEIMEAPGTMLRSCLYEDVPPPFDKDIRYEQVFQRVTEIQAEQCDAIVLLYKSELFRPAYAVLRSILEGMATLVWISLEIERYCQLFEENKQPNTKAILARVGWSEEYERTFQYLSKFTHIDIDSAEFYRNYGLGGDPLEPFPEILPSGEYYLVDTAQGMLPLGITSMSSEEISSKYAPYLAIKTFDIVAAGLKAIYGDYYYQEHWWQEKAALLCMQLSGHYPDIEKQMLWSLQMRLF